MSSEIERDLRALARTVVFPPTPDLAAGVRRCVDGQVRSTRRRPLTIAIAVVAAALVAAFAVPPARSAILRLFGIGAVRIEFVDRLPELRPVSGLDLGVEIDPADSPFPLARSKLLGPPDGVYLQGEAVSLLYGTPLRLRLLVVEIAGSAGPIEKLAGPGTRVDFVTVTGATGPAVWIAGQPHLVVVKGGARRVTDTLLWRRGPRTFRLEGTTNLGLALRIAESFE